MKAYEMPGKYISRDIVEEAACQVWGIPRERLYERNRSREIADPRHAVFFYLKVKMKETLHRIIRNTPFDHTTVLYAVRKVSGFIETRDKEFMSYYNEFINKLEQTA